MVFARAAVTIPTQSLSNRCRTWPSLVPRTSLLKPFTFPSPQLDSPDLLLKKFGLRVRALASAVPSIAVQQADLPVREESGDRSGRDAATSLADRSCCANGDGREGIGAEGQAREGGRGSGEGGEGQTRRSPAGSVSAGQTRTADGGAVGEGVEGLAGGDEGTELGFSAGTDAQRDGRRARRKIGRETRSGNEGSMEANQSPDATDAAPRRVAEWRTRPLVPHGVAQWPQIQSLAATSAGASLSIDAIFASLGLPPLADGHPQLPVRVRQHVNPLKSSLMRAPPAVDWAAVYDDPRRPLFVDIGSASGRLLLALAVRDDCWRRQQQGGEQVEQEEGRQGADVEGLREGGGEEQRGVEAVSTTPVPPPLLSASASTPSFLPPPPLNFLGFEIRDPLVQRADTWRRQLALRNAHFVVANATSALESVLATYPGPVVAVSVLCPDPHFKKKHRKRRVVQPALVAAIARVLVPGGHVFVQSDVEEVAADMCGQFLAYGRGEEGREEGKKDGVEGSKGEESVGGCEERAMFIPSDSVSGSGMSGEEGGEGIRWLDYNPLGVPSEREVVVLLQGSPMYRALFTKR